MSDSADLQFLSLETVYWLHRESLKAHGGLDGVRDAGAIEAALGAALHEHCYGGGDRFAVAAAYAFHLAQSQAFLDGNKRVAVASALTFLGRPSPNQDELYDAIAERRLSKAGLAAVLRQQFRDL